MRYARKFQPASSGATGHLAPRRAGLYHTAPCGFSLLGAAFFKGQKVAINREQLMAATRNARRYRTVSIATLGDVKLRSLTQSELREVRRSLRNEDGSANTARWDRIDAILVAATMVDDNDSPLLTDDDAMGGVLDRIDGGAWSVLCDVVKEHIGWGADKTWKPVEDAAKN